MAFLCALHTPHGTQWKEARAMERGRFSGLLSSCDLRVDTQYLRLEGTSGGFHLLHLQEPELQDEKGVQTLRK